MLARRRPRRPVSAVDSITGQNIGRPDGTVAGQGAPRNRPGLIALPHRGLKEYPRADIQPLPPAEAENALPQAAEPQVFVFQKKGPSLHAFNAVSNAGGQPWPAPIDAHAVCRRDPDPAVRFRLHPPDFIRWNAVRFGEVPGFHRAVRLSNQTPHAAPVELVAKPDGAVWTGCDIEHPQVLQSGRFEKVVPLPPTETQQSAARAEPKRPVRRL